MRLFFWIKATAVIAGMLALSACAGETSDPQPQQAAPRIESTGMMTDGVVLRSQNIVAVGTKGMTRMTNTAADGTFTVNMAELGGPYLYSNTLSPDGDPGLVFLTSVATGVGPVNVTPLTTLLTAQLLGVTPANALQTFTTTLPKDQLTDEKINAAQAELIAFLQEALGMQVKSGITSFTQSSFKTDVGDPMYDSILALNAKMATNGTTLKTVAARIATGAQACLTEKIQISIGGQQKKFCPISKSDVPEEADTSILDYKFIDVANAVLLVKVRENTVLSVDFTTGAGVTYSCVGAACAGVSLGAVAEDQSRALVFGSLALTGNGSGALLDGTFIGPPPSIELPVLPCSDNRYFVILSNHSVIADCIEPNDPFGYGASTGGTAGHGRLGVTFSGQEADTGSVNLVVDRVTGAPVMVYFFTVDPDTSELSRYVCYGEQCNGVTWGPGKVDSSKGFTVELRTVTLDNTTLIGIDEDANPTGTSATFKFSGLAMFDPNESDPPEEPEPPPPTYPPLADCDPIADTVSAVGPGGEEFNLCFPQNDLPNGVLWRAAYDMGDGYVQLYVPNELGDAVWIDLHNGELMDVGAYVSTSGETFACTPPNCPGVTFTGPDANGEYTMSFSNTVLRTPNTPSEPPKAPRRVLTLTSGDVIVPPPPP